MYIHTIIIGKTNTKFCVTNSTCPHNFITKNEISKNHE